VTTPLSPPHPAAGIGFFEKWLSVWVAICMAAGIALGNLAPGLIGALAAMEYASVNLVVAVLIWAMVYPMMVNVDFASLRQGQRQAEGAGHHAGGELADQAVHHGGAGRAVLRLCLRAADRPRRRPAIHRRADPAGRGALHGDGVRVEPADAGRPDLHAGAGIGERRHHDLRLRADRGDPARRHRPVGAVGDAAAVGRALRVLPLVAGVITRQRIIARRPGKGEAAVAVAFTARIKPPR
jgi:hypothetical protein